MNLVVTTGALQIDLVDELEPFHEKNHAKNRSVIGLTPTNARHRGLNFVQRHGFLSLKQTFEDAYPVASNPQTLAAQDFENTLRIKGSFQTRHKYQSNEAILGINS
jgi:hypothetical protein